MNLFLKAKHWQLFLATFALPFLLQMILMFNLFISMIHKPNDPSIMLNYFRLFPLMMIMYMGILLGWQWSVAIGLQKFVPEGIKMKVGKFKTFFIIPVVYLLLILVVISFVFSSGNSSFDITTPGASNAPPVALIMIGFIVIFPLHLFSMFCLFYCLYFVAKTFKTVELQREVSFSDFAGEFFLIWFYFVGVWIVQPKINKMIENANDMPTEGIS